MPLCPEGFVDLGPVAVGATATVRRISRGNRFFALKRLHYHLIDQPEARSLFADEITIGLKLKHRHLVPVLAAGEDELGPYQIQEYAFGPNLAAVLEAATSLPLGVAARIAADVALGLAYAHALKDENGEPLEVVHRDINPSNLIVTLTGETRVIDFGVAWFRGACSSRSVVRGTAAYLAPEQARGEPASRAVDLFALGAVLFEMLTGTRAFPGPEPIALAAIGSGELPRLPTSLPGALTAILRALLAPLPKRAREAAHIATALAAQAEPHTQVVALLKRLTRRR